MRRKRTGIFGGSFNPIHNGHVALASRLRSELRLEEVWLLVTPQNPWKSQAHLLDDELRLEMTRLALEGHRGLVASDFEFGLPKPSYTWNTLQALSHDFPERKFTLLVGGDNWVKFNSWYEHDKILANYNIAVYPRPGAEIDGENLPQNVRLLHSELIDISSTDIRQRVSEGLPIDHLVPPPVAQFIAEKALYL